MRKLLLSYFLLITTVALGQNIKLEIADYSRKIDGKEYATFQFARSSYSSGRPTVVFITTRPVFLDLTKRIPQLFDIKQEYTDVWILGITGFDQNNINDLDKKIISMFLQKIIKYRNDNDLPIYTIERLEDSRMLISNTEEICNYISCRKKPSK